MVFLFGSFQVLILFKLILLEKKVTFCNLRQVFEIEMQLLHFFIYKIGTSEVISTTLHQYINWVIRLKETAVY